MKKILSLLLAMIMALGLTACGNTAPDSNTEPSDDTVISDTQTPDESETPDTSETPDVSATTLEPGQKYSVADYMEFELVKIETTEKISAALGGMMSYSPSDGETYVDIVVDATITSPTAINSTELATGIIKGAGEYTRLNVFVETGSDIDQYTDLAPLSTYRLHLAFPVAKTETALAINLDINGSQFTADYTMNEKIADIKTIAIGDSIETPDVSTIVFTKMEYTDDLMPSNTSGWYTHYAIENTSNTYLALHFDVTNLQANAKREDTFLSAKATYMDKYNYTGFVVVEDSDGAGFGQYEDISPLSTRHFVCLIEVPDTVVENPVTLTLNFGGTEYTFVETK